MNNFKITAFGRSDIGKKQSSNQDAIFFAEDLGFFCIADGIPDHRGGETASRMAVDIMSDSIQQLTEASIAHQQATNPATYFKDYYKNVAKASTDPVVYLKQLISHTSSEIHKYGKTDTSLEGMSTAVLCVYIKEATAYIARVGNSRAYLYSDGAITSITENAANVSRSLGSEPKAEADIFTKELKDNDIFIICSNGLPSMLNLQEMKKNIIPDDIEESVSNLINAANRAGGNDNLSVIMIKIDKQ